MRQKVVLCKKPDVLFPLFPDLDVATPHAEAVECNMQNIHYVGIVLLLVVSV